MEPADLETAVHLLAEAAKTGIRLHELPAASKPTSIAQALAMQEALLARIDERAGGWKVANAPTSGASIWGVILSTDCFASPAKIDSDRYPPLGVEGEIAFRFEQDLPQRAELYSRAEIEAVLTAFPAIEVVSSRFVSYKNTPMLDRLIDRMSNGGLIFGAPRPDWRDIDLSKLRVTLTCNGVSILDRVGGHMRGDPLLPLLDFVNTVQADRGFRAGEFITTGTFTDLVFAEPGQQYIIEFHGFGRVELSCAAPGGLDR